ncbi:MAG: DUF72 domain-containing protein [Acidobacteria bacterium]|nr:DUF72 domain-containing protein [Acidobacteriota bacterium]
MNLDSLFIGTAGWSYKDWLGYFYPDKMPGSIDKLTYYTDYFDCVEINSSFYYIPPLRNVEGWIRKVEPNPRFKFVLKLWQGFTHHTEYPSASDTASFKAAASILSDSSKLGAILIQFPWSFKKTDENINRIKTITDDLNEFKLVLEIRHGSWNESGFYDFLSKNSIGFCNIDQPVIGSSIAPSETVTSDIGYARLHGRNYDKWFSSDEDSSARYNYLYKDNEIDEWVERIKKIIKKDADTFVITNNHWQGKAAHTALKIKQKIKSQRVKVPESLKEKYSDLEEISIPVKNSQSSLL